MLLYELKRLIVHEYIIVEQYLWLLYLLLKIILLLWI